MGSANSAPATINSWDGVSNLDNTGEVWPPDTEGDVGTNDYVQWVNLDFEIWDKTGTHIYGPAAANTLWSGFGGICETGNQGDPQVVFDRIADRWVFMQFGFATDRHGNPVAPYYLCFAVSQTSDPTGSYYRYAFHVNTSSNDFPDYPKLGVWPDGYYLTANNFNGNTFAGAAAFAFDRSKMLTGDPNASFVEFQLGSQYEGLLPANFTGSTLPPSGEPAYFGAVDTSSSSGTGSTFQLWKFHADFNTPASSTFTGPTNLTVPTYTYSFCGQTFPTSCIAQPGTSNTLDPLADRLMQRLQYRNLGSHEELTASHTVNVGSDQAGMRWYQFDVTPAGGTAALAQDGTYAPNDGISRWMGSLASDSQGNLALGYSMSDGSSEYPSVGFTGRLAGDPSGTMDLGETTMVSGSGFQTCTGASCQPYRWGDYSAMTVDPTDDQTFFYTQEYYKAANTGTIDWSTRVGSFRLVSGPNATLTEVNGNPVAFPAWANQNVTSLAGGCTPGSGSVNWSVTGPSSPSGTASCSAQGTWSASTSLSTEGTYTLSAAQATASTPTESLTIDKTAPTVALTKINGSAVTFPYDTNQNVTSIGGSCGTASGDAATVNWAISGSTSESGSTSCSSGSWSVTLPTALSTAGTYTVSATQSDQAGNSGSSGSQSIVLDKTAPTVAVSFPASSGSYDATSWNAGCTTSGVCGTASDSGSGVKQVQVSVQQGTGNYWNGTGFSSASEDKLTATGTTNWSLPFSASNFPAAGSYTVRAYGVDKAGNASAASTVIFSFSLGSIPTVTLTKVNGGTVAFPYSTNQSVTSIGGSCTTSAGNVTPSVNGVAGTAVSCTSGSWSASVSLTSEAAYTVSASQTNGAGTGSTGNQSLVIDKTAPMVSLTKVNGSTVTFPYSTNQSVTSIGGSCGTTSGDIATVNWSVSGTASANGSVACSSGSWSAPVSLSASGPYTLAATQSDQAGNTGSTGNESLQINPPDSVSLSQVNGTPVTADPYYTNQNVTSIGGSCSAGSVGWSVNGGANGSGSATCSSGTWSATVTLSSEGTYSLSATLGAASASRSLIIDTTSPTVSLTQLNGSTVSFPYSTNQHVTSIGGSCGTAAGDASTVTWSVSGAASGNGSAACSSGHWTASVSLSTMGSYTLSASQGDQAGNQGASGSQSLTLADRPPVASFSFSPGSPKGGQTVSFDASASNDPDGTISSFSWQFGDGSVGSGATPTHAFAKPGNYTVQLTVTDNSGSVAMTAKSLAVGPAGVVTSPVVTLQLQSQRLGSVLKHGLHLKLSSSQPSGGNLQLRLSAKAARALGLGNGKHSVVVGAKQVQLSAGRSVALTIKLSRKARSHLAHVKHVKLILTVVASGTGGTTRLSRTLSLS